MPGPTKRAKKKSKGGGGRRTAARIGDGSLECVDHIDTANGWTPIVNILCDFFQQPDLTTRKGLKKVHANFDAIYQQLENAYSTNSNNEKIKGGIVGIYSKMCADSLLGNRLYRQGLLDKLIPLLQLDSTRHMALSVLLAVIHRSGQDIRVKIASLSSSILTTLIEAHLDDEYICEATTAVLQYTLEAVTGGGFAICPFPEILKSLDMVKILQCAVKATKRHYTCLKLLQHATRLIAFSTLHAHRAYASVPEATRYLIAGTRCKNWVMRCVCMGGLIRLGEKGAEEEIAYDQNRLMDAVRRGVPVELDKALISYGLAKSELFLILASARHFQEAVVSLRSDRDLASLGFKLAKIILTTEFSIPDGYFHIVNERTGEVETSEDMGFPFARYPEALPHCASAIRATRMPEGADAADILDIKFLIMSHRIDEATAQADEALKRSPDNAYFHYAISSYTDYTASGLRACKKGIKCKNITPFIRWQLTQRAVNHAGDFGIRTIQDALVEEEHKWEEGIAFLMSAYEDAKIFLADAPPDNIHMSDVCYWYILLTILIADTVSPDLRELKEVISKLKYADDFSRYLGHTPAETVLRRCQTTILKYFSASIKEFEKVFNRSDIDNTASKLEEEYQDNLATWIESWTMEEGQQEGSHGRGEGESHHSNVYADRFEMYRCSYCRNPSAALRKCSGCEKTRYCDATCQKSAWSGHKKQCRS